MRFGKPLFGILTWGIGIALLVLIIAYLAGAFRAKTPPGKLAEPDAAVPKFAQVGPVRGEIEPVTEKSPGTITARRESMISARLTARINEIAVRAGDQVTQGEVLVQLDNRDLEARVAAAGQTVAAAQARLAETRKQYERMQKLFNEKVVAASEFDAAEAAYNTAKAEVARTQQSTTEAGAGRAWATIEAPFAGRIVDRYAEPGDTAMPGQPLLKIYDPSQMRLETYVRESLASSLKPGTKLSVQIDSLSKNIEGRIEEIVPQSEPGSRSVLVKVALPLSTDLYPGMFGRLLIPAGQTDRLYIPERAIQQVGQLTYVWVIGADEKPQRRFVKTGDQKKDGLVEILSGINKNERVGVL